MMGAIGEQPIWDVCMMVVSRVQPIRHVWIMGVSWGQSIKDMWMVEVSRGLSIKWVDDEGIPGIDYLIISS